MGRVLALVTEAFGGRGGIARYNRDFLNALAASSVIDAITIIPRLAPEPPGALPEKITQRAPVFNPVAYSAGAARELLKEKPDVIFCGHIRMSPLAAALAQASRVPVWLQVHGVDAWNQPPRLVKWGAERSVLVTSVSRYTKLRFGAWWNGDPSRVRVLPNTVGTQFTPGPKPPALLERYQLHGKRVILTVSRLGVHDRYKGIERIISRMPDICRLAPDAVYLVVGDGDDAGRLRQLAVSAGARDKVVFAGHVNEAELPDHFRVADVYAMPSTKEGFGIVFLEAARSGLPVIGGNEDGSVDALADGGIGRLIAPSSDDELVGAILDALNIRERTPASACDRFALANFRKHVDILARTIAH